MTENYPPDQTSSEAGYSSAANLNLRIFIQERFGARKQTWFHWLFDYIEAPPNGQVVELGCGPGTYWFYNAPEVQSDWKIILTDADLGMVKAARSNLRQFPHPYEYVTAKAEGLPFPDTSVDLLIADGVLDIVPDLPKALAEAYRVLKPGRSIAASTAGSSHLRELEELVKPFEPSARLGRSSEQFTFENAAGILSQQFSITTREVFRDTLTFKEITPITVYIRSETELASKLSETDYEAFLKHTEAELASRGEIRVSIEKALFIARKES